MSDFISDADMQTALEWLAQDPHPLATTKGDITRAENIAERTWAELYHTAKGDTVKDRESAVKMSPVYAAALEHLARSHMAYENAKAKNNWAKTVCDCWQTQSANARAAERIR